MPRLTRKPNISTTNMRASPHLHAAAAGRIAIAIKQLHSTIA